MLLLAETAGTPQTLSAEGPESSAFDGETVPMLARLLAMRPHRPRDERLPAAFARLDYDGYRRVRFDPAQALWAGAGLPFQLQPHHRGFLFNQRVELFEVAEGRALPIRFQATQFQYEGVAPPQPDEDLGFAGFRLLHPLNRPDHFDELCSFLGASYFRALGRGNVYGISARGLAVGTAEPSGEEFPGFSAFWIERPDPGAEAITLHALMESASLTGAFHFRITPGDASVMQVTARLFPRRDVARIGVAPMTSMFFFGPHDRDGVRDYRPAVHDSDGLLMRTGAGAQIWRPLTNPQDLQGSGFQDRSPRGFGLLQRSRHFAEYQDLEAGYHRRPSLWVEPMEDWGAGEVQLFEIPTRSEIHDNIVAAWSPRAGLRAGQEHRLAYRLHWGLGNAADPRLIRFVTTRTGAGTSQRALRFVLDTSAWPGELPEIKLEAGSGELRHAVVQGNAETGGLRVSFEWQPGSVRLGEMRVQLMLAGLPVSEQWNYRWTA
jgi:periplasmic glucans biosynthesis protein